MINGKLCDKSSYWHNKKFLEHANDSYRMGMGMRHQNSKSRRLPIAVIVAAKASNALPPLLSLACRSSNEVCGILSLLDSAESSVDMTTLG